jgi:hypothetical protein
MNGITYSPEHEQGLEYLKLEPKPIDFRKKNLEILMEIKILSPMLKISARRFTQ